MWYYRNNKIHFSSMSYDSNRIALYLTGKLPPHYKAPIDKLYFIEVVRGAFTAGHGGKSNEHFPESVFDFIDRQAKTEEQFFSMVLNKAERIDRKKFEKLIETLEIHPDARESSEQASLLVSKIVSSEPSETKKVVIITEGKTDAVILKTAWKKLFWNDCPYDIRWSGFSEEIEGPTGAKALCNQLQYFHGIIDNQIIIWLFDNDKEGNDNFKGLHQNLFDSYVQNSDVRKSKTKSIYWMLLSVPPFRTDYVDWNGDKRYLSIEHYFQDTLLNSEGMKWQAIASGSSVFQIQGDKNKFSRESTILNVSEFENFRFFFTRIEKIILSDI